MQWSAREGRDRGAVVLSPQTFWLCSLQEALEHEAEGSQLQVGLNPGQGAPAQEPSPRKKLTLLPAALLWQPEEPEPEEQFLGAPCAVPGHRVSPVTLPHTAVSPSPQPACLSPRHACHRQLRARPCLPAGQEQGQETSSQSLPGKGEPWHNRVPQPRGRHPGQGSTHLVPAPRSRVFLCACERVPTLVRAG